jgi:hypothetical protein
MSADTKMMWGFAAALVVVVAAYFIWSQNA